MDKKYYHRGNGECVKPFTNKFFKESITQQRAEIIESLPVTAYCSSSRPVGWLPGAVEVYQVRIVDRWADVSVYFYNVTKTEKRIWLEVPEQTADQPHKCQYCGAMTTQPDEQCWNNPKNHKFAEGEDDIAKDTFEEKPATDYNKEAEERYPITDDMDFAWKELAANARVVHVTAREISAKELAELREENQKLKTVMIAAAEEIKAHWEAHCDKEGYGPEALLRRLEAGIPAEYGYTSGRFAELREENERLREGLRELLEGVQQLPPLTAIAGVLEPQCNKAKQLMNKIN